MDRDKLSRMANAVRTGGKGTVRRKRKAVHKTATTDDKRLQNTLKRLNVTNIPGIEEVNIVKEDVVITFNNPKVQASIPANTYVVSGTSATRKISEMMQLMNEFGNSAELAKRLEQLTSQRMANGAGDEDDDDDDDNDVPELVENFEEAAK